MNFNQFYIPPYTLDDVTNPKLRKWYDDTGYEYPWFGLTKSPDEIESLLKLDNTFPSDNYLKYGTYYDDFIDAPPALQAASVFTKKPIGKIPGTKNIPINEDMSVGSYLQANDYDYWTMDNFSPQQTIPQITTPKNSLRGWFSNLFKKTPKNTINDDLPF